MKLLFKATLPCFPPSVNQQTVRTRRGGFDSTEYRQFKSDFHSLLHTEWMKAKAAGSAIKPCPEMFFALRVEFFWAAWKTKKGMIAKKDVSNRYKSVEDSVCRFFGIDDSLNIDPSQGKRLPEPGMPEKYIRLWLFECDESWLIAGPHLGEWFDVYREISV